MNTRVSLALACLFLLAGCNTTTSDPKKDVEAKQPATKDDPVVISDGSVRLYFRAGVFSAEALSPVYGCCLAAPAVRGKKQVKVYKPETAGSQAVRLAQTLDLNEADVLQFHLERQGEAGWAPLDNDRFPTPQLVFFRRDLSSVEALKDAQYADFATSGKSSWIVSSEMTPKAADELDALGKSLNMRRQYEVVAKSKIRLGRLVLKRADNSSETVPLGNGCSAVEICTAPNCLAGMNSPCPGDAAPKP